MARLPLIDPATAPPEIAHLYAGLQDMRTPVLNVAQLFGNHPGFLNAFIALVRPLYATPELLPRYRELAYLRASQLNACHY